MNFARLISVALALASSVLGQHGPISGVDRRSDPTWEYWLREELGGYRAAQLLRLDGELIAVTHGRLFRLNAQTRKWIPLGEPRSYDAAMAFEHGLLTSSRELGLVRLDAHGRLLETVRSPLRFLSNFRKIAIDGTGRIWVVDKEALLRLQGTAGALQLRIEALPGYARCDPCGPPPVARGEPMKFAQVADIEIDPGGRPWVAYGGGVAWLDLGGWRLLRTDPQLTDLRSLALAGEAIWVAGRAMNYFFRMEREADHWAAKRFMPVDGYGPPDTFFIKRDSRGWIWRGSSDGVHVSDGTNIVPEDWLHFNARNGLACGEADNYGFFEDEDRSVWIAGEAGITHLKPSPDCFEAPKGTPRPNFTAGRRHFETKVGG